MAKVIPALPLEYIRYQGERDVYRWLRDGLSDEHRVFYSVRVLERTLKGRRFEREADFTIIHPVRGMLVIEVKGGGDIELRDGRWWSHGAPIPTQPVEQAQRAMHAVEQHIWKEARVRLPFSFAVAFPHILFKGTLPPGLTPGQLLDSRAEADVQDHVERAYRALARPREPLSQEAMDRVEVALTGSGAGLQPIGHAVQEAASELWQLDKLQRQVFQHLLRGPQRLLYTGGAGTGKTELAFAAAVRRAKRGERVLFTCFNEALATWLAERADAAPELEGCREMLKVQHIHGFARDLSRLVKRRFSAEASVVAALLEEASMRRSEPGFFEFDAIVIDEGQDFHAEWFLGLAVLTYDANEAGFVVCMDPQQRLFDHASLSALLDLGEPLELTINYRNARPIADLCASLLPKGAAPETIGPPGPPPQVQVVRQEDQARLTERLVAELIRDHGVGPEQIVCVTPWKEAGSLKGVDRLGGAPTTMDAKVWRGGGHVLVTTARSFKGLETDVAVLFDVGDVPSPPTFTQADLYVACSRARAQLFVITHSTRTAGWLERLGAIARG